MGMMVTFKGNRNILSIDDAAKTIGVNIEDINPQFGVTVVDEGNSIFVVLIDNDDVANNIDRNRILNTFTNPKFDLFS